MNPAHRGQCHRPHAYGHCEERSDAAIRPPFYGKTDSHAGARTGEGADTNILSFPDYDQISKWAIPYVQWAVGAGLMLGRDNNGVPYLTPLAGTMRSEAATLQMRFCEKHGI